MGVVCSRKSAVGEGLLWPPDGTSVQSRTQVDPSTVIANQSPLFKMLSKVPAAADALRMDETQTDRKHSNRSPTSVHAVDLEAGETQDNGDRNNLFKNFSEKAKTKRSRTTVVAKKVNEVGSLLGRAGTAGLGKAVEALDTLGSSMTNLNVGSGFASGAVSKGSQIQILAFEVANTIVKGHNLKQSLSDENVKILSEDVLRSKGVQRLVSTDMAELLSIAAADKRKELEVFAGEVVRFGNRCRDPQWHNLDRHFEKLGTELTAYRQSRDDAEEAMLNLSILAQNTAELYHELNSMDRFEAEIRRKFQEEDLYNNYSRGDTVSILRNELKSQKKHLKNLKKKSLWSKTLEEVMEMLVDTVYFLHQEIQNAFGDAGKQSLEREESLKKRASEKLGSLGLALHYASIISQIDGLVSQPGSVPLNTRENLYQGLPPMIKGSLRHRLSRLQMKEECTVSQTKAEMEEILSWLVPIATNTTKAHHGFGWVGEWANNGSTVDLRLPGQPQFALIQTLHHADRRVTEEYLLELIVLLHHLVDSAKNYVPGIKSPLSSPFAQKSPPKEEKPSGTEATQRLVARELSPEDQDMLKDLSHRKLIPGMSKSQEFEKKSRNSDSLHCLTKSNSLSPSIPTEDSRSRIIKHVHSVPVINFDTDKGKALDVIDRVDNIK